jgi:hypothetical protein
MSGENRDFAPPGRGIQSVLRKETNLGIWAKTSGSGLKAFERLGAFDWSAGPCPKSRTAQSQRRLSSPVGGASLGMMRPS